jgi:hypothetical protein
MNNNVRDQRKRFKNKRRYDDFMYTKELDIIKALIDENVVFNLFDE